LQLRGPHIGTFTHAHFSARIQVVAKAAKDAKKHKHESVVDKLASNSWVSQDFSAGGITHKKIQRFVDTLA
jgi:hypothetical protein